MKEKKFNPWKRATFVLGALVLIFGTIWINDIYKEIDRLEYLTTPESMCSRIKGTPSWADYRGAILGSGVQYFNNTLEATNILINESVYLLYSPGCYYCQIQITMFGEDWERYKESGLAIDCSEVKE